MKKYLLILIGVAIGLGIVLGGFWFFLSLTRVPAQKEESKEKEVLRELKVDERPYINLTPRKDGHELTLAIAKIPSGVNTIEYELGYKNKDNVQQGATGQINITSPSVERKILLGTCSSGRCRYDEGVEQGTLSLRLRDEDGKLVTKLTTGFTLSQGVGKLSSSDGKLIFSGNLVKSDFYVIVGTFGFPGKLSGNVAGEPYGIFTSGKTAISGTVTL